MASDVIATGRKFPYQFATGTKLILFKHVLLLSILMNNRVIVIGNRKKIFQLQLKLSTFGNSQLQLQLQQNHVINYNFVNYNYNFSKPALELYLLYPMRFWVPVREHLLNFYRPADIKRLGTSVLDNLVFDDVYNIHTHNLMIYT